MADAADPAVVRAVLREHGHDVPDRGRISMDLLDIYEGIVNTPDGGDPGGEYDEGISAADFPPDDPEPEPVAERRPRRVRQSRPPLADRLRGISSPRKGKTGARKRKHPRVPVDRLVERGWELLARLGMQVSPPIGRVLDMQAPVAGLILEDVIRDTVADRALQPIARAEEKAEKVIALVAPPVIVGALAAAQGLPEDQRLMRQAFLVPMLRESLVIWVKIAGDKIEERATRELEMGPINEQVDKLMASIFAMPTAEPEQEPAGV
jgi:hypothetical protein